MQVNTGNAYQGLAIDSGSSGGQTLTINQGTAAVPNFTDERQGAALVIDAV